MSSKSNSTRKNSSSRKKSLSNLLHDPMFAAMERGNLKWGNILASPKGSPKASRNTRKNSHRSSESATPNELENWTMPNLTLRKGIWENFPVTLVPLDDNNDGTERYAVEWHKKNLREWRESRSASYDEWMEYQAFAEFRLIHALRAHSHKYTIEPPRNKDQILVLAMVHSGPREAAAGPGSVAPRATAAAGPRVPVLRKLNDIKEHFPVVWHPVTGAPGKSTYAIELFGKKIREMSTAVGHDVTREIKENLLRALRASHAWTVLPAGAPGEVCRLQIA